MEAEVIRKLLERDIEHWKAIRDGREPLVVRDRLGVLCDEFKLNGCNECPLMELGYQCKSMYSTWVAYHTTVSVYERRGYLPELQEKIIGGSWDSDCSLFKCINNLIFELEEALISLEV